LRFGHHTARRKFVLIVVGCWTIGFFGLSQGRFSVIQLAAVAALLVVWYAAAARRRRMEAARGRWLRAGLAAPHQAASVRRLDDFR
jgi:hypothetical protein